MAFEDFLGGAAAFFVAAADEEDFERSGLQFAIMVTAVTAANNGELRRIICWSTNELSRISSNQSRGVELPSLDVFSKVV